MKALSLVRSVVGSATVLSASAALAAPPARVSSFDHRRPAFEPNVGQFAPEVRYAADLGSGSSILITRHGPVVRNVRRHHSSASSVQADTRYTLLGRSRSSGIIGVGVVSRALNCLHGSDPTQWRTGVASYQRVVSRHVYPHTDVVYYVNAQGRLEYDFVLRPGADPERIVMRVDGASDVETNGHGDLVARTALGDVVCRRPIAYQDRNGVRLHVPVRYRVHRDDSGDKVTLSVGRYDPRRVLVVDPELVAATYLGGSSTDSANGVGLDASGNIYVAGYSASSDYPVTPGVVYLAGNSYGSMVVSKISADGTRLMWSTRLGPGGIDSLNVDANGRPLVVGYTDSPHFPTTSGAYRPASQIQGTDIFVAKMASDGRSMVWSTLLGGSAHEGGRGCFAPDGAVVVSGCTWSSDFPTTSGAYRTTYVADNGEQFVTKIAADGGSLVWSTFVTPNTYTLRLCCAPDGDVLLGWTGMYNLTPTPGAYQPSVRGGMDIALLRLSGDGATVRWATWLGGSAYESLSDIKTLPDGRVAVCGSTDSVDYPTTPLAFQTAHAGYSQDGFVTIVGADGTALSASTHFGAAIVRPASLAILPNGSIVVAGSTNAPDFPVTSDAFPVDIPPGWSVSRSTDQAQTWSGTGTEIPSSIDCLLCHPTANAVVLAGGVGGVYRSTDRGDHWQRMLLQPNVRSLASSADGQTVYAAADTWGVSVSFDGGVTWAATAYGSGEAWCVSVSAADPLRAYVADRHRGVLVTDDGGATWRASNTGLDLSMASVACDPNVPDRVYAGTAYGRMYMSSNAGQSWVNISSPSWNDMWTVEAIAVDPFSAGALLAALSGVYRTGNCGHDWGLTTGLAGRAICFDPSQAGVAYAAGQRILRSSDGGRTWSRPGVGDWYDADPSARAIAVSRGSTPVVFMAAVDPSNNVGFVSCLSSDCSVLLRSTLLSGHTSSQSRHISTGLTHIVADGSTGTAFVGTTTCTDFPITEGAYDTSLDGFYDIIVGRLSFVPLTVLVLDNTEAIRGSPVELRARLTRSSTGAPVAGQPVSFTVDGVAAGTTTTGPDGVATLVYTIPPSATLGTRPLVASFAGDEELAGSSATATITIRIATSLFVVDRTGVVGEEVELRAYLTRSASGSGMSARVVAFSIDGAAVGTGTTDATGKATSMWLVSTGPSMRTIAADYTGDTATLSSHGTGALTCLSWATKMATFDRTQRITGKTELKCRLLRSDNVPLANRTIDFSMDGTFVISRPTNTEGYASYPHYTVPDGVGSGERTILSSFAGNAGYGSCSKTARLTVLKATPYIWVMPRSVPQGGVARLYAYFRRLADYQKQEGKTVSFKVDGTWVADAVTGSGADAGIARCQYTTVEPPGAHIIRCEFAGDAWVDAGYGEGNLTIY